MDRKKKVCMKRTILALSVLLSIFLIPALTIAKTDSTLLGLSSIEKMKPEGEYIISIFNGDKWQEAGRISCDRFFRERKMDLSPYLKEDGKALIRLTQRGGGAAHIDSVLLGGTPPFDIKGSPDALALKKLSKKDFDVTDAYSKDLELTFPSTDDRTLTLTARIEGTDISKIPFQFPVENLRREMNTHSRFYTYKINSEPPAPDSKLIFKEYSKTGSGHPSGFTYGWAGNDRENLYVKIDFTPDNTMDGNKDYAKVYIKTDDGIKEFKISELETKWGTPQFIYTDKVLYQHKVYEFKIPLKELSVEEVRAENSEPLQLAFSAYGTAAPAPGDYEPAIAYDALNNMYLVVYRKVDASYDYDIYGQLLNHYGMVYGTEFIISDAADWPENPSVAYDSVNERFLVAWSDDLNGATAGYDIYGQLVNANSSLYGANFVISNATNWQSYPSVAYDSVNQRFLVVWEDYRNGAPTFCDIYGQLVNANGLLNGTEFIISNASDDQYSPSVAYDSANERFLVAWEDGRNSGALIVHYIYGQLVNANGSLYGTASDTNFVISNAALNLSYPSVAYDSANERFLVAWEDGRNSGPPNVNDIYGQLVNANGTLYGTASNTNFVISNASSSQYYPSVAYDSANERFLVAWDDYRNEATTDRDIYGQLVNANGTLYGTASDTNFIISNASDDQNYPSTAYNSICANFMVAFETGETGSPDIGISLIGTCTLPLSPVYLFWSDVLGHYFTIYESEKDYIMANWPDVWQYIGISFYAYTTQVPGTSPVYLFWSDVLGHYFTIYESEKDYIMANWPDIWQYIGISFYAYTTQEPETSPVYLFWSDVLGHYFTIYESEKDYIIANWPDVWEYIGISFYAYP